jgi:hypothetical protein
MEQIIYSVISFIVIILVIYLINRKMSKEKYKNLIINKDVYKIPLDENNNNDMIKLGEMLNDKLINYKSLTFNIILPLDNRTSLFSFNMPLDKNITTYEDALNEEVDFIDKSLFETWIGNEFGFYLTPSFNENAVYGKIFTNNLNFDKNPTDNKNFAILYLDIIGNK